MMGALGIFGIISLMVLGGRHAYRYGFVYSDESDLGIGANRIYSAVMHGEDLADARKRVREVVGRLKRDERTFANALLIRRMSSGMICHRFRLERWEYDERYRLLIEKVEAMNLEPLHRPFRSLCPLQKDCGMARNLLSQNWALH